MSTAPAGTRPATITWSFVIWVIGAIFSVISAIAVFILLGAGAGAIALGGAPGAAAIVIVIGVIYLVIAIIELIIVVMMRNGRNWARILLTIFAVLQVIGAIGQGGRTSIWGWITLALVVLATILMYVPSSNAYFSRRHAGGEPLRQ